jgi:hypothetical protein
MKTIPEGNGGVDAPVSLRFLAKLDSGDMAIGCPIELTKARQIGLLLRAQQTAATTSCPIDFQQTAQLQFLPERRTHQSKQPGEAVAPLAQEGANAQQQVNQQRGPHLPPHRVGVVAQGVGQLEGLLEFLKKRSAPGCWSGRPFCASPHPLRPRRARAVSSWDRLSSTWRWSTRSNRRPGFAVAPALIFAHHPGLQIIFGPGHPEHLAQGQIGQMGEVHMRLSKITTSPARTPAQSSRARRLSCCPAVSTMANSTWHSAAALRRRCLAQSIQRATSWMVVLSTT